MKYFKPEDWIDFNTLRTAFRRLCLHLHPDKHPGEELFYTKEFKNMQAEYQSILNRTPTSNFKKANTTYSHEITLAEKIKFAVSLSNVTVEICGSWIWLSGATYAVKALLKQNDFKWHARKKRWYWGAYSRYKRSKILSMDEIRARYGSTILESETDEQPAVP